MQLFLMFHCIYRQRKLGAFYIWRKCLSYQ